MQTNQTLQTVTGKSSVCRSLVYKWHKKFSEGLSSVKADTRSGRPAVIKCNVVRRVEDKVMTDRRVSVWEIGDTLGISIGSVRNILKTDQKMNKACARCVPRLFTAEDMSARVKTTNGFVVILTFSTFMTLTPAPPGVYCVIVECCNFVTV